jgi:hypothetical protein
MADTIQQEQERKVNLVITIRLDNVPVSDVARLEEEAMSLGDEYGAQTDIIKSNPRPQAQGG